MKRWQRLRAVLPDVCSARTNLFNMVKLKTAGRLKKRHQKEALWISHQDTQ